MREDRVVGRGHHRRTALTDHHERIDLEAPLSGDFQAVVRLIIGGIAERVDFAFEEIDDLQLAVERLLAEAGQVGTCSSRSRWARAHPHARRPAVTRRRSPRRSATATRAPGQLTLRRILQTVVDSFGVEDAGDGGDRRPAREAQGPGVSATTATLRRQPRRRARERGPRAAAPLPRGRRHHRARGADRAPPAAGALAGAPLRRPRRGARGHRAGRRDRADQGDRPLRARARGLARHLRHAERRRRDQAPLPRQGLGDPRAARAPGAERVDVRRDRAAHRQARALAEHRRDRRGAEDHAGGGARGDGGRAPPTRPSRCPPAPAATTSSTRSRRSAARTRSSSAPRTAPRSSPRSTGCPQREREILRMRFEEGLPQTQIAQRVGLSQMHVSRLIRKSLSIMREELLRMPPGRGLSTALRAHFGALSGRKRRRVQRVSCRPAPHCLARRNNSWRELMGKLGRRALVLLVACFSMLVIAACGGDDDSGRQQQQQRRGRRKADRSRSRRPRSRIIWTQRCLTR